MSIMPFVYVKLWCPLKRGCSVPAQNFNFLLVPSLLSSGLKQGKNERFKAKKANRILQSLAIYWQSRHRGIVVLNSVFSALALLRVHPNEPKNKYTQ